ncbi:hypothetical protein OsccyDRAFT_1639 [Leptolyngbyaceae cyanobacterium JSC-12]|nr:hypothetical protein OsccyDRAFT_1639 [Leptolyngbyaceae cyanobacterium JSC-12]
MSLVFHITPRSHWQQAQPLGEYQATSLDSEGFIHCSTASQVVRVANLFYQGQTDLVLLCIDVDRVQPELRYDVVETGEQFPHIYGALNLDAVVQVVEFEPNADGWFELPAAIA